MLRVEAKLIYTYCFIIYIFVHFLIKDLATAFRVTVVQVRYCRRHFKCEAAVSIFAQNRSTQHVPVAVSQTKVAGDLVMMTAASVSATSETIRSSALILATTRSLITTIIVCGIRHELRVLCSTLESWCVGRVTICAHVAAAPKYVDLCRIMCNSGRVVKTLGSYADGREFDSSIVDEVKLQFEIPHVRHGWMNIGRGVKAVDIIVRILVIKTCHSPTTSCMVSRFRFAFSSLFLQWNECRPCHINPLKSHFFSTAFPSSPSR